MRKLVLIAGLLIAALAVAQVQIVQPGSISSVPALPAGRYVGDTLKVYNNGSSSFSLPSTSTLSLPTGGFTAGCLPDGGFWDAGTCTYTALTVSVGDTIDMFWDGTQWVVPTHSVSVVTGPLKATGAVTAVATQNSGGRLLDGGTQTVTVLSGEHCICQDVTDNTKGCKAPVSTTTATIPGTSGDSVYYLCF